MIRNRRSRSQSRPSPLIQALESRQLFAATLDVTGGALHYTGSGVANVLTVSVAGGAYTFNDTGETITLSANAILAGAVGNGSNTVTIPDANVDGITINTEGGTDTVNIRSVNDSAAIDTGLGVPDSTVLGFNGSVDGINGDIGVSDFGGVGSLTIDDFNNPGTKAVTINNIAINGLLPSAHAIIHSSGITELTASMGFGAGSSTTIDIPVATDLQTLTVNGGTGNSVVNVIATPSNLAITIDTQVGVPDTINVGTGNTSQIFGTVNITDAGGVGTLNINDSASGVARNVVINSGVITGAAPGTINYLSGITQLNVSLSTAADTVSFVDNGSSDLSAATFNGGDGGDTFSITPSTDVQVTVNGGDPSAPTATPDNLILDLTGVTNPHLSLATNDSGTWTFGNRQNVAFTGIESYDPANIRAMVKALGLSKGHETATLAKLNLKGNNGDVGKLNAFINFVDELLGKGEIDASQAAALTLQAQLLIQVTQSN